MLQRAISVYSAAINVGSTTSSKLNQYAFSLARTSTPFTSLKLLFLQKCLPFFTSLVSIRLEKLLHDIFAAHHNSAANLRAARFLEAEVLAGLCGSPGNGEDESDKIQVTDQRIFGHVVGTEVLLDLVVLFRLDQTKDLDASLVQAEKYEWKSGSSA